MPVKAQICWGGTEKRDYRNSEGGTGLWQELVKGKRVWSENGAGEGVRLRLRPSHSR